MTYNEFIQNIIDTRGQWNIPEGEYYEMHHIKPRCVGGTGDYKNNLFRKKSTNSNCIWLYPKEHFIAHKLLAEENPENKYLVRAFANMCTQNIAAKNMVISAEMYEEAKNFLHANLIGYWKNCKSEDHPMFGKDRSGKNNPFYGKTFSDEALKKISSSLKNWKETHPEEFRKNQSRPNAMNGMAIAVYCIEADKYFGCIKEAYIWLQSLGIQCPIKNQGIRQYLNKPEAIYGYHWIKADKKPVPKKEKSKNHGWWKNR